MGLANKWSKSTSMVAIITKEDSFQFSLKNKKTINKGAKKCKAR
jgi:hypothetical protein